MKQTTLVALIDWAPGTIKVFNGEIYGCCDECLKIVHINKWLFGSLHLCLSDKEIAERKDQYKQALKT